MTTSGNREKQSVLVSGDNMRAKHHCEVLIMNRNADGPGGEGNYYNSLGVVDDVPDEEFDARFRALDPEQLRQEYGGDAVRFNGPRRFLADRFTAEAFDGGKVSMVGTIPMYLYGTFVAPDFDAFIAAAARDQIVHLDREASLIASLREQLEAELRRPAAARDNVFVLRFMRAGATASRFAARNQAEFAQALALDAQISEQLDNATIEAIAAQR